MKLQQNLDVFNYGKTYLSPILRRPNIIAFLYALLDPLQKYRNGLTSNVYPAQEREAHSNSQIIRFEKILNTKFNSGTAIYISDGPSDNTYIFNEIEVDVLYIYNESELSDPIYIYNEGEFSNGNDDFVVNVPQSLYNTSLNKIKAAVERYKIASIRYSIRPY